MKIAEFETLRRNLMAWYRIHQRDLPWRRTRDPYAIWVSEVMLQQTRVATVLPYYHRFLARFPGIAQLAAADLQAVLKHWEGLGYYARARNFHRAARIVCEHHRGIVPREPAVFRQLPGVGDYIAAAVLSIAFHRPLAVIDGNVKRVLARLFRIDAPVDTSAGFRRTAQRLLDTRTPGTFNQALMELGALVCRPRTPECGRCPLAERCEARAAGQPRQYPIRRRKHPVPEHRLVVAVIRRRSKYLITRREEQGLLGGLWEFPAARIGMDEIAEKACRRTAGDAVNLQVRVDGVLTRFNHAYSHFMERLEVCCCRAESGRVRTLGARPFRWIRLQEADRYPFTGAALKILARLRTDDCRN